jgi:hypothetical protein
MISRGTKSGDTFGNRTTIPLLPARGRVTLPTELSWLLYEYLIVSLWISVCRKMVFRSSEELATYLDELRWVQLRKLTTHYSIHGRSWLIEHCLLRCISSRFLKLFQVYQQISEPQRNRWFAFLSVPTDSSTKQAPISYAIYRWRGIHSFEFIFVILSQPIRLVVVYITPPPPSPHPPPPFSRRSVLLDATLLMCCTSPVIPSQFVSIFNLVNPRSYNVFMHLCQFRMQITLSIHVVFPFVFASHSPAHVFRVVIPSLLSFNAATTNERGWATAECAERPLILR